MKKDEELVKIWYYADRTMRNYDNAEMTPRLRYLVPEWYDKGTGQVNLRPTARDLGRGNLEKRTGSFARGDVGIVLASFAMHFLMARFLMCKWGKGGEWSRQHSK